MDIDTSVIREAMEVVGDDGKHVGIVDRVEGDMLKLGGHASQAQDQHHWIPLTWVVGVDHVVRLNLPSQHVLERWLSIDPALADQGDRDDAFGANRERAYGGEVF